MTAPTTASALGVRGAAVRGAVAPRATVSSGDAFAAALSKSQTDQRRPAARPAERPEPSQSSQSARPRRLESVATRRGDLGSDRGPGALQRDRHGPDLGVTRPRTVPGAAGSTEPGVTSVADPTVPAADVVDAAGSAVDPAADPTIAAGVLPFDAAALLAQQVAAAEAALGQGSPEGETPVEAPAEPQGVAVEGAQDTAPAAPATAPAPAVVQQGPEAASAPVAAAAAAAQPGAATSGESQATPGQPEQTDRVSQAGVPAVQGAGAPRTGAPTTEPAPGAVAQGTTVPAVTTAGAGDAAADLGQGGSGGPTAEAAAAAASPAQTASSTTPSSFAQTLAGLTPVAGTERLAAPVATPSVAAPQAPTLAEQVRTPLVALRHAAPGTHTLTLQVTPDSLGPVQVTAHIGAAGVRIELLGATDAGREGLRALLTDLRRDLAGTGMNASLSLAGDPDRSQGGLAGDWSGGQQDARGGQADAGLRGTPGASAAAAPEPETTRPTTPTPGAPGVDVLT